jgi:hypothetical protein
MKKIWTLLLILIAAFSNQAIGQVSIATGSFTYSQNFDGLANSAAGNPYTWTDNSTIPGWYCSRTLYNVTNGATTQGSVFSFGTTDETDRALGAINSNAIGIIYHGLRLKNDVPDKTLTSITLSFDGEQWRDANANDQTITFSYQTGASVTSLTTGTWTDVPALSFTSPQSLNAGAALNGNLAANRTAGISTTITLSVPSGQEVMLRWTDDNATGSDHGLAIDNVSISAVVLPITLTKFDAQATRSTTQLAWTTATESNNKVFNIERSTDGRVFEKIGEVNGAGNSLVEQQYAFEDTKPAQGVNYYRLQQVDFDGQSSYSPVRSVVFGKVNGVVLYPAPVRDQLNIRLEEAFATDAQWQIVDMAGRIISEGQLAAEQTEQSISTESMSEGLYVLRVVAGQQVLTQQFKK